MTYYRWVDRVVYLVLLGCILVERDLPERPVDPPWVHDDTPPPRPLLTINDVCRRLDVDRTTVYRLISTGMLRSTRIGSHLRVAETELARMIEKATR